MFIKSSLIVEVALRLCLVQLGSLFNTLVECLKEKDNVKRQREDAINNRLLRL